MTVRERKTNFVQVS